MVWATQMNQDYGAPAHDGSTFTRGTRKAQYHRMTPAYKWAKRKRSALSKPVLNEKYRAGKPAAIQYREKEP